MTEFARTPDVNFEDLDDFQYEAHFHQWQDMRVHYLDEGPRDGPVMLLCHGMPTWSYLYRHMIPALVEAGYRCIAPDHLGFGKSDKPLDLHWYTIARHTEVLSSLVVNLDLNNITLVCQDWGGPTGLAQAAMMPERFSRLCIMNTWLHHEGYEYSEGIRNWNQSWHPGGRFDLTCPDIGLLLVLSAGLAGPEIIFPALAEGRSPALSGEAALVYRGFSAPYRGLPDAAFNGYRRFPRSIPMDSFDNGNAAAQALHYRTLLAADCPSYFIWGCSDNVFTEAWGRTWAERMGASFDPIPAAGHFLQNTHGPEVADLLLKRIAAESA
ncbi:MAG: alpha/beta fold hydrolase, partial [Pseudomonadales bacterium]|jgi:haloalkane dehalogenase|nr:alpha/beta fold hydrolase [Pseudomonadales bacterium]